MQITTNPEADLRPARLDEDFFLPIEMLIDAYKLGHILQYPEGTEVVESNFTARTSRITGIDYIITMVQPTLVKLDKGWRRFFETPWEVVEARYKARCLNMLGDAEFPVDHIKFLWDLQELPLRFEVLPDGTKLPIGVPMLKVRNTVPETFWLTNYIETWLSQELWQPITTATQAYRFRTLLDGYAEKTSDVPFLAAIQGHDFSARGMAGSEAGVASAVGHLTAFIGTDDVAAVDYIDYYYGRNHLDRLVGITVPATEHAVMCAGGKDDEKETYLRLLATYPAGILSVVSDTWDYWKVLTELLPDIKDTIMARDGKLVIRPDSGDPVKIICGDPDAPDGSPARLGSIQVLDGIFGSTVNSKGYKELDPHIGLIYGDSITYDRATAICEGLMALGYASTNVVFGIGSYTYQYVTRDTFGFAMKATLVKIDGVWKPIFKDPATDNGTKKSGRGYLTVHLNDGVYTLHQADQPFYDPDDQFIVAYENGKFKMWQDWEDVVDRVGLHNGTLG